MGEEDKGFANKRVRGRNEKNSVPNEVQGARVAIDHDPLRTTTVETVESKGKNTLEKLNASPLFLTEWTDPTFLFGVSTLFSVCFVTGDPDTQQLNFRNFFGDAGILMTLPKYLCDIAFLAGAIVIFVARYFIGDNAVKLSSSQKMRAGWFLWNAVIFHIMMDGFAGGKWGNKLMADNYELLDRRFCRNCTSNGEMVAAKLIVNTEILVHAPLCVITYVAIATGSKLAAGWELITLTWQLFGLLAFVGPDFLTGCLNMVPHGEEGCLPEFTPYNFFFSWFGVGINIIWAYVPICMMFLDNGGCGRSSMRRIADAS